MVADLRQVQRWNQPEGWVISNRPAPPQTTDSAAGELFLIMNDDIFLENSGRWTVTITTS